MRKNPTIENTISYRKHKAIVKLTTNRAKTMYWDKYCKSLNRNTNLSNVWKTIHRVKGIDRKIDQANLLKTLQHDSPEALCNSFAKHFQSMSSDHNLEEEFKNQQTSTITNKLKTLNKHEKLGDEIQQDIKNINNNFSTQELDAVLVSCNKKSSTGPDMIPYLFIINLSSSGKECFLRLINKSLTNNKLPTKWKQSFVKPILKQNKNKGAIESYRPISLISCLSKVMEKMINNRLVWFLEKKLAY